MNGKIKSKKSYHKNNQAQWHQIDQIHVRKPKKYMFTLGNFSSKIIPDSLS